jgi:hypothetical protein
MTLCHDSLNVFPRGCTRPHAVSDRPRKRCVVGEVGIDMYRIAVAGNFQVRFIGKRRAEVSRTFGRGECIAVVGERGEAPLRSTVTLDVRDDRIALAIILLEVP